MSGEAKVTEADRLAAEAILELGEPEAAQFVTLDEGIAVEVAKAMQPERDAAAKLAAILASYPDIGHNTNETGIHYREPCELCDWQRDARQALAVWKEAQK